jgi:hypothetical protein
MQGGGLTDWLSSLPILAIGFATFAVMLVAAAAGQLVRQLQARRARRVGHESEPSVAQEGYLLGGVLGLLGLLLAFSFGMVLNRYESRRELVIQEANAIGTAYLRAQLLDEPHRKRLSKLLMSYTDNRIKLASADLERNPYLATNDRLLTEIWAAVRAARDSALTHGVTTALLITFNEVIDLDTERKVAWQLRVPSEVLLLLIAYLSVTAGVVGHAVDGPRGRRAALVLFLLIGLSIGVITDINRPMSGRSRESQEPMLMLLRSLKSQPPEVFNQFELPQNDNGRQGLRQ